jgi:hypothetical protein
MRYDKDWSVFNVACETICHKVGELRFRPTDDGVVLEGKTKFSRYGWVPLFPAVRV